MALKKVVRRAVNSLGYDIVGYNRYSGRWRIAQLLKRHGITTVFDVGANEGSFGWSMRELGFRGRIVSFEPMADAFGLLEKAAQGDTAWQAVNVGLGATNEERVIHVAANSQSSSFLPMLDAHKEAAPESLYERDEPARIRRLDGIFSDYCTAADRVFLKIDTQGFERQVIEGARSILGAVPLLQMECSLVPLYDGDDLLEDMFVYMRGLDYDPIGILPTFHHHNTSHLMQVDALFLRRDAKRA